MSYPKNKDSLCPQLQSLNMSFCNLTKIPEIIFSLKNLTELNLCNNNLMNLPHEIGYLHNLSILNISENKLTNLPKSVKFIHNLNSLDISYNNFCEVPQVLFNSLGVLKILNLSFNFIESFECVPRCINTLKILNLSDNRLNRFPKWILHSLCQLIALDISNNGIFPFFQINAFCTARIFESLQFLNVENCNLSGEKITFLTCFRNLEVLCMGNKTNITKKTQNYFGSLKTDTLKNFKLLKCLYLQNIKISTLPSGFNCIKYLEVLDFSENFLSWLPDCICDLLFLKILNLTSNQLIFLPDNIYKLINLNKLLLANNNLNYLPEGICSLNNLEYVDLYNNKIEEIDFKIFKKNLKGMDLGLNCLQNYFLYLDSKAIQVQYEFLKNSFREHFNLCNRNDVQYLKTPDEERSSHSWEYSSHSESASDCEDLLVTNHQVSCQHDFREEDWEKDVEVFKEDDFNPNDVKNSQNLVNFKYEWGSDFPNNYCPGYNRIRVFRETYMKSKELSMQLEPVEGQFDSD